MSRLQLSPSEEIRRRFGKDKVRYIIVSCGGQASTRQIKDMIALHDPSFKTVNRALEDLVIDYTIVKVRVGTEWSYKMRQT